MTHKDIFEKLAGLTANMGNYQEARVRLLGDACRWREDLEVDSLDIIELIMYVEDEFEIAIDEYNAAKLATVGEAVDYIAERVL